jgi:hypothetical protein
MKFLLDVGISPSLGKLLERDGHELGADCYSLDGGCICSY